jgi:hypothetical protein
MKKISILCVLSVLCGYYSFAQDFGFGFDDADAGESEENTATNDTNDTNGFGFGFGEDDSSSGSGGSSGGGFSVGGASLSIGGEVNLTLLGYYDDLKDGAGSVWRPGILTGKLNFKTTGNIGEAVINLKLNPAGWITKYRENKDDAMSEPTKIVALDEIYGRAFLGNFELEAGMRKLTWGRADSMGPMDVINPYDFTTLTNLSSIQELKIPVTLLHGSYHFGTYSKIETVFVPVYEPWHYASNPNDRWLPVSMMSGAMNGMGQAVGALFMQEHPGVLNHALGAFGNAASSMNMKDLAPDTTTLGYAQAGARYTTTFGGSFDFGAQYYYGRMYMPSIDMSPFIAWLNNPATAEEILKIPAGDAEGGALNTVFGQMGLPKVVYNDYHQIGVDGAMVLGGFNLRGELAANITRDLSGDDPSVANPQLAWSLGFDRDLFWKINLNLQCNETVRLLDSKITKWYDTEYGKDITNTRFTLQLSRKFWRDELELKLVGMIEPEDQDYLMAPQASWTRDEITIQLATGFFGGKKTGFLGEYDKNDYLKFVVKYVF